MGMETLLKIREMGREVKRKDRDPESCYRRPKQIQKGILKKRE
ncbi:hypothetical protein [Desulfospira joergensenii]|nr:hypothetical protein [Desulfospira joergensenii]